jgi:hypothetical protein
VTFEEGTWAVWLFDLLKPRVTNILVCDPRRNALLNEGSKSDRIDARKLAELLRGNQVKPIYHGEQGVRTVKELVRSYLTNSLCPRQENRTINKQGVQIPKLRTRVSVQLNQSSSKEDEEEDPHYEFKAELVVGRR